ncbi:hypothetical protein [Gordonia westfalica]|uniref:Transmembrane protein n=1 Tax=Gordonia westfalica TaxID=158898 RepID=A0A1H2K0J4_9ACTN|nr:hypothetical protein [Gordonia westfalica]SDU62073.1 hypothetical protein SAMN04488548_1342706 [Gordonia westfalica]
MSNDSEPESRPISVSELLARSQAAGGTTPSRRDGRGRRRAGRDGSVSVSELTGEIPKITDASAAQADDEAPSADSSSSTQVPEVKAAEVKVPEAKAPEVESAEVPEAATPETPSSPFPRSGNPVARRAADDRPVADRPRPDRPFAPGGPNASGMPGYGVAPPATRDFSSDAVARRMSPPRDSQPVDEESANAVTGIIPVVDGPGDGTEEGLVVVESDDVVTYDLTEVDSASEPRERRDGAFSDVMDFDAYRNFADVEGDADTSAQPVGANGPKKGAKSLGGLARKLFARTGRARGAAAAGAAAADAGKDTGAPAATAAPSGRARAAAARARDDDNPTEIIAPIESPGDEAADIFPDESETWQASAQWYDTEAWSAPAVDEEDTEAGAVAEPGANDETVDLVKHETVAVDETADLDESLGDDGPADDTDGSSAETAGIASVAADAERGETQKAAVAREDTETRESGEPEEEQSPVTAWLLLFAQAVVGLAVGVGLFWGFTELWRWNPYFALVLAVLVIFGIVTLSHVVRRTKDLATTLLALGVGLLVTIGPLVLLAT